MKVSNASWAERLAGKIPEALGREIDIFETEIALRKQGKLDERLFAETRLRRGVYGQRYDNGQRHDGKTVQRITYPSGELTKGPNTMWDAPGMQRIKIPAGGLNAPQLETMAELAEEYSDGIAHITTRQDFQLHYIHIDDTPSVMRRLAAANITTREACGNSVRNVTACPYCRRLPGRECLTSLRIRGRWQNSCWAIPICQNFGRKFKPRFSGCAQHACGLASLHDMGLIAATRTENGKEKRGFDVYVGGGLGAVPYLAKLFDSFVPPEEMLPLAQAIARVFAGSAKRKIAAARASSFWCRIWASRNSRNWCWKSARTLSVRSALDRIRRGRGAVRGSPAAPRRPMAAAGLGSVSALGEDQHAPAEAGRLRGRHGRAAARRHHRQSAAFSRGYCPPLYEGDRFAPQSSRTS